MTAFRWSSSYDADVAEYESPDVVKQYYSSSFTTPSWSNPTLAEAFGAQTSLSTEPTSSAGDSADSPSDGSSSSPSSASTPILPIVLGVVGGVVLIVAVALGAFCLRRRRRNKQGKIQIDGTSPYEVEGHQLDLQNQKQGPNLSITRSPPSELGSCQPPAELPTGPAQRD
ncbi:hypothetical protein PMZ80_004707 [Knufia obscura]|uniref:Uncharacterized protein n=2 Tax=Knufia TaxID=430999 RepID=A0AAN8I3I3_9EURO|nr:hypothetical protein PMZ80_004707 [Knufia obscura]KAK5952697.1 hypothetical protein OHC33_006289 [Knufia fluminis]